MATTSQQTETECPTCGDWFASERGMKIHHAKAHGESISGAEIECASCGDRKRIQPSMAEADGPNFCDRECFGEWYSENRAGEDHPSWKPDVVVECSYCGDEMRVYPSKAELYEHQFCDPDCYGEWCSENRVGEDHPRWKDVSKIDCEWCGDEIRPDPHESDSRRFCDEKCHAEWQSENMTGENSPSWNGGRSVVECSNCGDEKRVKPNKVERKNRHFCDRGCFGEWKSENWVGEDAPFWRGGGVGYYGPSWPRQRRRAVGRDDEECVLCGLSRDDHRERHGQDLHVHHKKPLREFGVENHEEANRLDNLVTLCRTCHAQVEPLADDG